MSEDRDDRRQQFERINNPRSPSYTIAIKLNLPPSYLMIHRVTLGSIGVLCQLEAEAPYRIVERCRLGRMNRIYGRLTWEPDAPAASEQTIYDLASLTKVVAELNSKAKDMPWAMRTRLPDGSRKLASTLP